MKSRRVGTVTFGIILILLGILLLLHIFIPELSYMAILNFWPVILIVLGLEVLIANFSKKEVTFLYDGWAIFLLFLTLCFTMCMGILDFILVNFPNCISL